MRINVMYDFCLSRIEIFAIRDAISEIRMQFEQMGLSNSLGFRLYGDKTFLIGAKAFSADKLLELARSLPLGMGSAVDAKDLARLIQDGPFSNEGNLTLLFTSCPIATPSNYNDVERKCRFSEGNVCIFSMAPYHEEQLMPNDEYRVIKLITARELGLLLGAMKYRREKVAWDNGILVCTSDLCVLNRTNSTIQKMGLAWRLDVSHNVYCPHCMNNIKQFYHLSTQP